MLSRKTLSDKLAVYAVPFAAGALLAAVFMDLLPDGLEEAEDKTVFTSVLIGVVGFFIAERFLRWFHHHHEDDPKQNDPSKSLIVAGDTLHNALDGVAIAAAFLVNVPTGIVTALAVAAHEIPQEVGDFGLLLAKGMKRRNVLIVNILSSLATTVAAVITFALGSADRLPIGILLGIVAGFLLYIAMSDLIPTIHANTSPARLLQLQTLLLIAGVLLVSATVSLAGKYVEVEEVPEQDGSSHVEP